MNWLLDSAPTSEDERTYKFLNLHSEHIKNNNNNKKFTDFSICFFITYFVLKVKNGNLTF